MHYGNGTVEMIRLGDIIIIMFVDLANVILFQLCEEVNPRV